jgi:hypothetical protein
MVPPGLLFFSATAAGVVSTPGVSGQGGIGVIGYSVNADIFGVVGRNSTAGGIE